MTRLSCRVRMLALCAAAVTVAACVTIEPPDRRTVGIAALRRGDGTPAGIARLLQNGAELVLRVEATGLPPGRHGLHLHTVGRCDPPEFTTAQGHWNPTSRQHGSANPAGPHAGDVPNIDIGADGRGTLDVPLNQQGHASGLAGLFDADGTAVVVHAGADDLRTDPSGGSGARIACGVLTRS